MKILKRIKNSKLFQILGFSWLICLTSHVIIPIFVVFPIFDRFIASEGDELGFFAEMIIFTLFIIPVSLLVTFIHSRIKKREHCCEHSEPEIACRTCPHKDDAVAYVRTLQEEVEMRDSFPQEIVR